jgi:putative ABC transport system permease protein
METFLQDLTYAVRRLARAPGFTLAAVLTLALGIGANSAIFTVVNAVLLRPLPYPDSEQLVGVFHQMRGTSGLDNMSPPNFLDLRARTHTLADVAASSDEGMTLTGAGAPVRLRGSFVSASFFDVLGVRPILGRSFRAEENEPGKASVVLLSHGLWVQRFGGDSNIIGKTVRLDGVAHTVVGVMPPTLAYPAERELWVPFAYDQSFRVDNRGAWFLDVIGRMKDGVSPDAAVRDIHDVAKSLEKTYPKQNTDLDFAIAPLHGYVIEDTRASLLLLLGAVGFVLLIACANVANLTLARAAARESELAVRTALGASRWRLVRQLITESVLVSMIGAVAGLLVAAWGGDALAGLKPLGVPRLGEARMDGAVIAFTIGIALVTGLLVGAVPALQATGRAMAGALKDGGRGALTGRRSARILGTLVAGEIALAVALLAGAGLLVNSFYRVQQVDPGFRTTDALTFGLSLPDATYKTQQDRIQFFDRVLDELGRMPGVRSAGAVVGLPLTKLGFTITFKVDGRPEAPEGHEPTLQVRVASPDYFRTMGLPLKRGRVFTSADVFTAPQVALLTESAVQKYFPSEDPIGRHIDLGWRIDGRRNGGTVVGIVGDVKDAGLDEASQPEIYLPYDQVGIETMTVVVRGDLPPRSYQRDVERVVSRLDPDLPLSNVKTLEDVVSASVAGRRFYMLLLTLFAVVAMALAAIGIFGVMSYAVAQQTREIGIRMALGADRDSVVRMVLRQASTVIAIGLVVGLAAAAATGRALAGLLFNLTPTDPMTLGIVAVILATVALLACYLPARRATRIDPIQALRAE